MTLPSNNHNLACTSAYDDSNTDNSQSQLSVAMAGENLLLRTAVRLSSRGAASSSPPTSRLLSHARAFSATPSTPLPSPSTNSSVSQDASPRTTHFGFQDGLSEAEKTERVAGVFHSVAESYDRMNDLMSFGWHRIWKYAYPLVVLNYPL